MTSPSYPGALDALANPGPTTETDDTGFELDVVVARLQNCVMAIEQKLGIGAGGPPSSAAVLRRTTTGTSLWGPVASGDLDPSFMLPNGSGLRKLYDSTLGAPASSISIPNISQAYAHLTLSLIGPLTGAAASLQVRFSFDGTTYDNVGPYDWIYTNQTGTAGAPTGGGSAAGGTTELYAGSLAVSYHSSVILDIPQYSATLVHFAHTRTYLQPGPGAPGATMQSVSGLHRTSVNPVKGLYLFLSAGQFGVNMRVMLHGWPGTLG